jgi:hypothetical protein
MYKRLLLLAFLFLCVFTQNSQAQVIAPSMKWFLDTAAAPLPADMSLEDPRYSGMTTGDTTVKNRQRLGYVRIGFDKNVHECIGSYKRFVFTVLIQYDSLVSFPNTFTTVTETKEFTIDYDPTNMSVYKESAIFFIPNAYKVEAVINSIEMFTSPSDTINAYVDSTDIPPHLYLELALDGEQYQNFDVNTPPDNFSVSIYNLSGVNACDTHAPNPFGWKNTIEFKWNAPTNGETDIEIEWTYVDNFKPGSSNSLTDTVGVGKLRTTFTNNATRVRIPATYTNYVIPALYDRGWIVARIRGVGRNYPNNLDDEIRSKWSVEQGFNKTTRLDSIDSKCYVIPSQTINWMSSATFAEEGKNKFVTSYADGSSRVRQQVTLSSTETIAIATETFYDHQGRAAVQTLPAPVLATGASYYKHIQYFYKLNKDTLNNKYSRTNFDMDVAGECYTTSWAFSDTSGSGRYYSSHNQFNSGAQAFVPDANGYPFTVTQFTPDNTGRIARQSGVGSTHKIGSGHETQYFYGTPGQVELNRLFGTDVGFNNFYQKNMVIDANGQISVSYVDMAGRTIATSLAGDAPGNVDELKDSSGASIPDMSSVSVTEDLIGKTTLYPHGVTTVISPDSMSLSVNYGFLVSSSQAYALDYSVEVQDYVNNCMPDICFECEYDLKISVTDRCGAEMLSGGVYTQRVGGTELDTTCTEIDSLQHDLTTITLEPGEYTVSKSLKIVEASLDYYVDMHMKHDTCLLKLEDFYVSPDTSDCGMTCESCRIRLDSLGNTLAEYLANEGSSQPLSAQDTITLTNYYNSVKSQCDELCQAPSLDNCNVLLQMLLNDMSPGGQYAEFKQDSISLVMYPEGPLSILNTYSLLPQKYLSQFSGYTDYHNSVNDFSVDSVGPTIPTWKRPKYYIGQGRFADGYMDENGDRVKIYLEANEDLPTSNPNHFMPATPNTFAVYDDSTDSYYTYPEHLLNVGDFINIFQPSFAKSLIVYHPEYFYYEWCADHVYMQDTVHAGVDTLVMNSNEFDYYLRTISLGRADTLFGPSLDILSHDPFFLANPSYLTPMGNAITNFIKIESTWHSIYEAAYIAIHLTGNYAQNANTALTAHCSGTCTTNEVILGEDEWKRLVDFYLSAKQKVLTGASFNYTYSAPRNINTLCIGSEDIGGIGLNFINPCNQATAIFYKEKLPRAVNMENNTNEALDIEADGDLTADQLIDIADYNYYKKTGKCPLARDVEAFLTALVGNDTLTSGTSFDLRDGAYLPQSLYNIMYGSTSSIDFLPSISTNGKVWTWDLDNADACSTPLTLNIPPGLPSYVTFDNITDIFDIHDISYNGSFSEFKIRIYVKHPSTHQPELYEIEGKVCLDIKYCSGVYVTQCSVKPQAKNIVTLMNALTANGQLNSLTPVALNTYNNVIETEIRVLLGSGTLYWIYIPGTTPKFKLYSLANNTDIEIHLTDLNGAVLTNPMYVKGIAGQGNHVSNVTSLTNTFELPYYQPYTLSDIILPGSTTVPDDTLFGYMLYHHASDEVNLPVTECDYAPSISCNNQENQNLYQLEDLLDLVVNTSFLGDSTSYHDATCLSSLKLQSTNAAPNFSDVEDIVSVTPDLTNNINGIDTYGFIARVTMAGGATDFIRGSYCKPIRACETTCSYGPTSCIPQDSVTIEFNVSPSFGDSIGKATLTMGTSYCIGINPQAIYVPDSIPVTTILSNWAGLINTNTPYATVTTDSVTMRIKFPSSYLSANCPCSSNQMVSMMAIGPYYYSPETVGEYLSGQALIGNYLDWNIPTMVPAGYLATDNINCCVQEEEESCVPTDTLTLIFNLALSDVPTESIKIYDFGEDCIKVGELDSLYIPDGMSAAAIMDTLTEIINDNEYLVASYDSTTLIIKIPTNRLFGACACDGAKWVNIYRVVPTEYGEDFKSIGSSQISCCQAGTGPAPCLVAIDSVKLVYAGVLDSLRMEYDTLFFNWLDHYGTANTEESNDSIEAIYDWYEDAKEYNDTLYLNIIWAMIDSCDAYSLPDTLHLGSCDDEIVPFPQGEPYVDDCVQSLVDVANANARFDYDAYLAQERARFKRELRDHCLNSADEAFSMTYNLKEYHFTLYYYDQAGNLYRTVPPKAVRPILDTDSLNYVTLHRLANTSPILPAHAIPGSSPNQLVTEYRFNSLNQPVQKEMSDGGLIKFYYDQIGRMVYSQNAKQALTDNYSYTKYDNQGRIIEIGQLTNLEGIGAYNIGDSTSRVSWEGWIDASGYEQVTRTYYDVAPNWLPVANKVKNIRKRIVATTYEEVADTNAATYKSATFYTYDILGNAKQLWQYNSDMPEEHRLKTMYYYYDLASGKVNAVAYQPYAKDQFYHKYKYDADNRITAVYTWEGADSSIVHLPDTNWNDAVLPLSRLEHVLPFDEDARYFYYHHGGLARTELGDLKVQGIDFMYTIQGWIKGVNSVNLKAKLDPGIDGKYLYANNHSYVARDAFSYTLNYFANDYTAIDTSADHSRAKFHASGFGGNLTYLYNGNIAAMTTTLKEPGNNVDIFPQGMAYNYDQLNRISDATAYRGLDTTNNKWMAETASPEYYNSFTYDANGNIMKQLRNGGDTVATGDHLYLDSLQYHYYPGTNQLAYVNDKVNSSYYTDDIDDQSEGNYTYDANGNLISDIQGGITAIDWTVYGKIRSIDKTTGDDLRFAYSPDGQRITKVVDSTFTFYVRDASGNIMATYTYTSTDSVDCFKLDAHDIHGSGRLGVRQAEVCMEDVPTPDPLTDGIMYVYRGYKHYELSNHLGNVLTVISDRRDCFTQGDTVYYEADIISTTDYYVFGAPMVGRTNTTVNYRFGFNGQEKDDEIYGSGNVTAALFWEYDSRIGRRWNIDPDYIEWESPYSVFHNNPVKLNDPDGDKPNPPDKNKHKVKDGDSPSAIAKKAGISLDLLAKQNPEKFKNYDKYKDKTQYWTEGQGKEWSIKKGDVLNVFSKVHFVLEAATPNIYKNTLEALASNPANVILTYNGGGDAAKSNRYQACKKVPACGGNKSRDEFPYATTMEGGAGAQVDCVPVTEQSIQAVQLKILYKGMTKGDKFLVVCVPNIPPQGQPETVRKPERVPQQVPVSDPVTMPQWNPRIDWEKVGIITGVGVIIIVGVILAPEITIPALIAF